MLVNTKDTVLNDDERNNFLRTENCAASLREENKNVQNTMEASASSASIAVVTDIEDMFRSNNVKPAIKGKEFCSSSFSCSGPSRQHCHELIEDYRQEQQLEFQEFYNNTQSLRHTVLLILLLCSMFVVRLRITELLI